MAIEFVTKEYFVFFYGKTFNRMYSLNYILGLFKKGSFDWTNQQVFQIKQRTMFYVVKMTKVARFLKERLYWWQEVLHKYFFHLGASWALNARLMIV